MALFKPSNFYPNLEEIDLKDDNIFSCQINSSGNSVKAYKIWFLSSDNIKILESEAKNLATPVKNKNFLNINNLQSLTGYDKMTNGKDYKWAVRVYDAEVGSQKQPDTLVCNGFIVGSTKNVIWTKNNDKLEYDRWIEFKTTGSSSMMPILEPNSDNLKLPEDGEEFVERKKISWVTKDLGNNKDITKIETDDSFTYNYINDTKFTIYQCSDQHGYNNVFVDPNDVIELGMKIEIYNGDSKVENQRKIIGYSDDTGEIRVQEPFTSIPKNGYTYKLYKLNDLDVYEEVDFSGVSNKIGGAPIEDNNFKVITNVCSSSKKILFIQPNINIKSDETNPNEIVFSNGVRVDIQKKMDKDIDITFDKLDNTQWIVSMPISSNDFPIIPQTKYQVFSDFVDATPENIFYAKDKPIITLQYKNENIDEEEFENIDSEAYKSFRDVKFNTIWDSEQNVQIKNYQYFLYDSNMNLISESDIIYEDEIVWIFRGLETGKSEKIPNKYYVKVIIEDEYGKVFEEEKEFKIYYYVEETILPLEVVNNCEKNAFDISFTVPIDVLSTDIDGKKTVDTDDINLVTHILEIPKNEVANYTKLDTPEELYIKIPSDFSFISSLQLNQEFIKSISSEESKMKEILCIGNENSEGNIDFYSLRIASFDRIFYYKEETGEIKVKINDNQFKLFLYKNDEEEPLTCFNNGTENYFDLSKTEQGQDLFVASYFSYALQDNSENNYELVKTLPSAGNPQKKYVLTEEYMIRDILYSKGIYTYNNNRWKKDLTIEYVFIDNKSLLGELSEKMINIPDNCLDVDGNTLKFVEENNIFIESSNNVDTYAYLMSQKWLIFYLSVNQGKVIADIILNGGRV